MKLLEWACSEFDVDVTTNAFLGAGAFGLVFAVQRKGNEMKTPLALKLVMPDDVADLEWEMLALTDAKLLCPELVVGVEKKGFVFSDGLGGALLLSDVGEAVSKKRGNDLILSLAQLHEKEIIHGDPRIQNAVSLPDNNKLMWIDFRVAWMPMRTALKKKEDLRILLTSLGVPETVSVDLVKDYTGAVTQAKQISTTFSEGQHACE